MAKQDRYEELANKLPELVGGKDNISFFTHCVTRLRFNLKDKSKANLEEIKKLPGAVGAQWSGDQLQVIIGQSVGDAYELICQKTGLAKQDAVNEDLGDGQKKKFTIGTLFDYISGSITPLIPVLIGCGMVKIIVMVGEMLGILTAGSPTYTVLTFVGDAGFYFLPVFIGATAAKKFGANMGLGMLMGAIFIHPSFVSAVSEGTALSIFGISIYSASYSSTIFPIILTVAVMAPIERFIGKHSPDAIRSITEPLFTILIMVPLALCVLGPIGSYMGTYLSIAVMWLYNTTGFLGVAVLACLLPLLVMTGMHTAFTPYLLQAFASLGYDPIVIPANIISNLNQGAASAAVALKAKDKNTKSTAASCAVTAIVGGVTEPAMFGVNLRLKTPLYGSMIGSFVGGAIIGIGKVVCYAFVGSGGIFAFPAFVGETSSNIIWMVIGVAVGMIVTFVSTLILYNGED